MSLVGLPCLIGVRGHLSPRTRRHALTVLVILHSDWHESSTTTSHDYGPKLGSPSDQGRVGFAPARSNSRRCRLEASRLELVRYGLAVSQEGRRVIGAVRKLFDHRVRPPTCNFIGAPNPPSLS